MLIPIDEVVHFDVTTHHPSTGAVTDADSGPTYDVFEEATDTPILDDQTLTKRTSLTGNYRGSFTASAANGFEAGKWYVVVASATVNSITAKVVAMHFRVAPAESAAGVQKADVSHFGGTAGTFASGRPEIVIQDDGITAAKIAADAIGASELAAGAVTEIQSGLATAAALSTVSGLVDDLESRLGTPSNLGSGATVAANLADIEGQTDDIGAAGAGLTAVPWNPAWDAEVQSEVQDALDGTIADSVPADGSRPSISQALYMLTQYMLERAVSGTTVTVKKPDGTTTLLTLTLNDATTPTSTTRAT